MGLRKNKENEKKDIKDIKELILGNKESNEIIYNDKIEQIKKFFLKNIPLKINNCYNNQKTNEEEDLYYIKNKNNKYKNKKKNI